MSKIAYDPIKDTFAGVIRRSRLLRRLFYFILDLFFLRGWHIRRRLKKAGRKLDEKGEWKLLDAGCGFGQYDRFILSRFKNVRVTSIDVKKDYLEDCRYYFKEDIKEGRIEFLRRDLLDPGGLGEREYDVVICIDVLEHIEQDRQVIQNIRRSLKPGGLFIMHSPSHYSASDADEDDSFVEEHARAGYSKEEIRLKLKEAGIRPDVVYYTYGRFGHLAWVLSVKVPLIWFNRAGMAALVLLVFYYPLVMPFCLLMNLLDLHTRNPEGNGVCVLGVRPAEQG